MSRSEKQLKQDREHSKRMAGTGNPMYKKHHSEETRKLMSDVRLSKNYCGENHPMFGKRGKDNPNFGKHLTEDHRKNISAALVGKTRTDEQCKRISKSKSGNPSSKHSKEWCINHSNKMRGRLFSEDHKKRIGDARRGQCGVSPSNETRQKLSESLRGERCYLWKGGISFGKYCPKFNSAFKRRVRAFFEHKCVECEKTTKENRQLLCVHHVHYDKKTCCKEGEEVKDRKFVALCKSHHTATNNDRDFWEDWYTEIINEFYGGQCYYTEKEFTELT